MKQTHINWRKATEEELINGASEMIKISEEEINIPNPPNDKKDASDIDIDSLTNVQLVKLKQRLNSI